MTSDCHNAGSTQGKRSVKNLLIDRSFQLKYTLLAIALVLGISLPLGVLLHQQFTETMRIGDEAVVAGSKANDAARVAVEQATMLNRRLETEALLNDAGQLDEVKLARKAESTKIRAAAKELADIEGRFRMQRDALAHQRKTLTWTLAAALTLIIMLVAVGGIAFTHRVAGPIFRMRQLFREVAEGQPSTFRPLRRNDELKDFFNDFWAMVEQLRNRQQRVMVLLDQAIVQSEAQEAAAVPLAVVREVRDAMKRSLEGVDRGPSASGGELTRRG